MTKQKLLKVDIPVIMTAFILAFISPEPVSADTINQHVSGIAIGFGLAWTLVFLGRWRRFAQAKQNGGEV